MLLIQGTAPHQGQPHPTGPIRKGQTGGDHTGPFPAGPLQGGALQRSWGTRGSRSMPAPELLLDAVVGGELGQGFLAHVAPLRKAHPIGQTQLEGIGVVVELGRGGGPTQPQPAKLARPAIQGRQRRQLLGQGGVKRKHQGPTQPPAPLRARLPVPPRARPGAITPHRLDPEALLQGPQLDRIGGEEHPVKGLAHGRPITGGDHQQGPLPIHQHLGKGPHPGGGGDAAGGKPGPRSGQRQILAALAMEKAQGIGSLQPQQGHGLLKTPRFTPVPRRPDRGGFHGSGLPLGRLGGGHLLQQKQAAKIQPGGGHRLGPTLLTIDDGHHPIHPVAGFPQLDHRLEG